LLLNNKGILKIADFGLGRWKSNMRKNLTREVVTFPYRAPELILGMPNYSEKVDIWSIGCIFAEWYLGKIVFNRTTPKE